MSSPDKTDLWIAVGLFIFSELVGMSKAKDNSITQVVLRTLTTMFPLEIKQRTTKRLKRDEHGRFVSRRHDQTDC